MWKTFKKFTDHVIPAIIKPLHILWNELIAFLFFVLAAIGVFGAWRSYHNGKGDFDSAARVGFAIVFGLVMLGYGFHSLFRARKIGKS